MTDEEWITVVWPMWLGEWLTAGSQDRRRELLEWKGRIEAATGWEWCPPYRYDNPPRAAAGLGKL